jgi:hypothetical protein
MAVLHLPVESGVNKKSSTAILERVHVINFNKDKILLNFENILHKDFPEVPSSGEVILINSGSSFDVTNEKK